MKCIWIVVQRLQPAYLSCYGSEWLDTTTLDRLATEGVVFDQCYVDRASVRGVRRSWFTGRHGFGGVSRTPGLLRLLWEHGVRTVFIGDERSPSLRGVWASGWEMVYVVREERLSELEQESLTAGCIQAATDWLSRYGASDHWLLWLELGALQPPWEAALYDEEAVRALEGAPEQPILEPKLGYVERDLTRQEREVLLYSYAGVVNGVDQWLGMLVEYLQQRGIYNEVLLVVTSDCGLPLGEHGVVGDVGPCLHEELLHIPLILRWPGGREAGRRVQQLVQPVDFFPTLLEYFEAPIPREIHGKSVLGVARGEHVRLREYACAIGRWGTEEWWSLRTHSWYLILPMRTRPDQPIPPPRLYIKPDDRWEVNDVHKDYPDAADHLELTLRRFREAAIQDRLAELPELRDDLLRITVP
ncbi:MAG: sulfatase [Gemmatales bacterium]|nr:sulfatase [Gemmatales bacterium]MDW7994915.1 sulfatase [Gemmatales bacterium]